MAAPKKVLVVSDDPQVRAEAEFGFPTETEVVVALDGRDGWQRLQEDPPAAVVVDLQTGSAGGFGLISDMQANATLKDIPTLMLLEREQDVWLARQAGARSIRVKPLETTDLVDEVLALSS